MAKILLVEDDNNLREIFEMRLKAEGYQTVTANNGEEALVIAMKEKPDLIIADVMMPKLSGFEMLETLRAAPDMKNTKVIMMTALGQAEDRARGEKLGVVKYLVKSQVTLEDFVRVTRDVLQPNNNEKGKSMDSNPTAPTDPSTNVTPPAGDPPADTNPISTPPAGDQQSTADESAAVKVQEDNFASSAPSGGSDSSSAPSSDSGSSSSSDNASGDVPVTPAPAAGGDTPSGDSSGSSDSSSTPPAAPAGTL